MPVPEDNVELTCTREVCHVVYSVPEAGVGLLRGQTCPTCGVGVLDMREAVLEAPTAGG